MRPDSDDYLVRYLLGDVAPDEAERLDERSISDKAFALRLRTLENDLVDRYARGEHLDESLERFGRQFSQSAYLRDKVRFAESLQRLQSGSPRRSLTGVTRTYARFATHGLAAAAVLCLAVAGYLLTRNLGLREELAQLEAHRTSMEAETAGLRQALETARSTPRPQPSLTTATFLLAPPRRGLVEDAQSISVPSGTGTLELRLQTEADGFETFWAALKDPATARTVWRSGDLPPEVTSAERIVPVTIPVELLATQRYIVELSGTDRTGRTELIGHYVIRVVLE